MTGMGETWMRWLGWTAMLLLVLGAVGVFFRQYRALDAAIDNTARTVMRDDLYLETPADPVAPNQADGLRRADGYHAVSLREGLAGECSGAYLLAVWTLSAAGMDSAAGTDERPAVIVDGQPLETLHPGDVPKTAMYRMRSQTETDGTGLTLRFDRLP